MQLSAYFRDQSASGRDRLWRHFKEGSVLDELSQRRLAMAMQWCLYKIRGKEDFYRNVDLATRLRMSNAFIMEFEVCTGDDNGISEKHFPTIVQKLADAYKLETELAEVKLER